MCTPRLSVLGPLLFILYVNDLPQATVNLTMTLYTVCTTLMQRSQSDLSQLVLGMKQTNDWLDKNRLTLNFDKTFFIQISKRVETKTTKYQLREVTLKTKNW